MVQMLNRWSLVMLAALSAGCGGNSSNPQTVDTLSETESVVTARVQTIDNDLPVDGGIRVTLRTDDGQRVETGMGSLFTHPRPSDEVIELTTRLASLEVGDWAELHGVATREKDSEGTYISVVLSDVVKLPKR